MIVVYLILSIAVTLAAVIAFVLLYRVQGQYFDAAGIPIHFTDEGQGTPIVLVHGFAVQADLNWRWNGCIRRLRNHGYRVIALDCRGHGRSGKPRNPEAYGVELADDVVRLLDHLGIEKAHLAGYSMGGFITLKAITRHPDRFLSGSICAAGWGVLDDYHRGLFDSVVQSVEKHGKFDPLTDWLEPSKKAAAWQCALANFFMGSTNDLPAIINVFKTFEGLMVDEDLLRKNLVPALTLVGERDGIREASDRLPGLMANHDIVYIPGGDHITTAIHPAFMRNMLAFLDANSPATEATNAFATT